MTSDAGNKASARFWMIALIVVTAALFAVDVAAPGGVAEGHGYAAALILCLWVPGRRTLTVTTIVMTVLIVAGIFIGSRGVWGYSGEIYSRLVALVTLWANYFLLSHRSLLLQALRAAERRRLGLG
jgi:hypothetical protein